MKYNYRVYGLNIRSEIEIEQFENINSIVDENIITISYGKMDKDIKDMLNQGKRIKLEKNKIWFHISGIATYFIINGNEIKVELCDNADMQLMKVYLMCSCLGFIMIQRDMIAIHGGVIEMNNKAIIFTGDRGAGKSTLTTALRRKGYKFISDDVAATVIEDRPYVMPGFPYQKLCESAMDKFGYNKRQYASFSCDKEVKYIVPAVDEFINKKRPLIAIVKLAIGDVDEVEIEEVYGSVKLNEIIANIYRGEFLKYLGGVKPIYFKQCLEIAQNIKFLKVTRPSKGFTVEKQIDLIEEQIAQLDCVAI